MTSSSPQRFKLRYLPLFWNDLADAAFYIKDTLKNPEAADRLVDSVEAGILNHAENPTIATIYKPDMKRQHPYYWFQVGNYMVFYVVIDDVMEVRRLIYRTRDLTQMLP